MFCTFPKRNRLYDAVIKSPEFYWNRPTDVPCQVGDRINAVITGEEIIGKTKYATLTACELHLTPLLRNYVAVLRPVARHLETRRLGFMPDIAPLSCGRRPAVEP